LRDLLDRATERPWIVCNDPDDRGTREVVTVGWFAEYSVQLAVATPGVPGGDYQNTDFGDPSTDAELTAEAVNALPVLLDTIDAQAAEIERLQRIVDSRPAINAGLPGTYIEWSQSIYAMEAARVRETKQ